MIKKYHIADLLTLTEVCLTLVLAAFAAFDVSSGWAFVIFCLAELCDAFDGIAARTWHYPKDGKRRWWREHAIGIDQASDIFLGAVTLIYVCIRVSLLSGLIVIILSSLIAIPAQFRIWWLEDHGWQHRADFLAIARRHLYLVAIVVVAMLLMWHAAWPTVVKTVLTGIFFLVGLYLWFAKEDRRTQNHTPLN